MFRTNFLDVRQAKQLASEHGTPLFVYSRKVLQQQAETLLGWLMPFGHTVRFAMKANPHPEILAVFKAAGLQIDASSGYEAERALAVGFPGEQILLTSQQLPSNVAELMDKGVQFNATSLHQLEVYGQTRPNTSVSVRINPGIGSGYSAKTNVGGVTSSFGIWYEYIPHVHELAAKYGLKITRLHTHIGSGTDPVVWQQAAQTSVGLVKAFPDAQTLNLGGGFKVARMDDETPADMAAIGQAIAQEFRQFADETGRELKLEIEPGTFLVANAGVLLSTIIDSIDTGDAGFHFLKLDTGMNDILRPSLYGAQHPIAVLNDSSAQQEYVVVGHNCESGDLLTPAAGEPETLGPRKLNQANIGDLVIIGGTGAYCASMAAHGYNSYPDAQEVMIDG